MRLKEGTKVTSIALPKELRDILDREAVKRGLTLSSYIRMVLTVHAGDKKDGEVAA